MLNVIREMIRNKILAAWCPPPKRWLDFNFGKLKSLRGRGFFHHMGRGASPYEWDSDNGNQKGTISQVKTIIIL